MLRLKQTNTGDGSRFGRNRKITSGPRAALRWNRKPRLELLEDRRLLSGNLYTVDSTTDSGLGAGWDGDLLYCITQANENPNSSIQFASGLAGTILTNTGFDLRANVSITGVGNSVTIEGADTDTSVFTVESGVTASIAGLTIANGYSPDAGGGVSNDGKLLTLTDDTFTQNESPFGGAVFNATFAALVNDTFAANSAPAGVGGGLANTGEATLINDTFAGNWAGPNGGGGIYNVNNGSLVLYNTIVANSTQGGDISSNAGILGTNNLIDDATSSGGFSNGVGGNLVGVNPLLAPLGNYGGPTETMALLPGSPAIDHGGSIEGRTPPVADQRGEARLHNIDIGAFESQGFTLTPVVASTPQTTYLNHAFTNPLAITVTANNPHEPVNGGVVSFAAPTSGSLATLSATTATIALGTVDVTAAANGTTGSYHVTATTTESSTASFSLANGALYTVTGIGNSGSGSGLSGDLPYCITQADANPYATIQFGSNVTGTIDLKSGLVLSANVIITGDTKFLEVEGGGPSSSFSVFTVDSGVTASISGLTITGGHSTEGGGVLNNGTLALTGDTVADNTASIDGGGLSSHGTATLTSDTFADNSAFLGGGISNYATATLIDDTIAGNAATAGGGLSNSGSVTLDNTIVATSTTGGDIDNTSTLKGSHDLIGDGSELAHFTNSRMGNPLFASLGNYGGPTPTMALLPGSPAIDAGVAIISGVMIPTTDQRGEARVGGVDIGSFESQGFRLTPVANSTPQSTPFTTAFPNALAVTVAAKNQVEPVNGGIVSFAAPRSGASASLSATTANIVGGTASVTAVANSTLGQYVVIATTTEGSPASLSLSNVEGPSLEVTTASDTVNPFDGLTSLREALAYAASLADAPTLVGPPTITFSPSVTGTIQLKSGLTISSNVTIIGPGASLLAVEPLGSPNFTIFTVSAGGIASISGLTITDGKSPTGGGVHNDGTLTLTNDTVAANSGAVGAGVYNDGMATLTNDTFAQNSASTDGGGVYNLGTATLTNVTIAGNSAGFYGGGIYNSGTATLINVTNALNSAGGSGGGVSNSGMATLDNTIVVLNTGAGSAPVPDQIDGSVSGTHNLIGAGSAGGLASGLLGNLVGVVSPGLAAGLADNDGPTQTIALLPGSPAIDAASVTILGVTVPTTDERGALRGPAGLAAGSAPDIGAYEASSTYVVNSTTGSDDRGTLRAAVGWANVSINANPAATKATPNTITFTIPSTDAGYRGGVWTIAPGSGLTLSNTVTPESIVGPGASVLTIRGGGTSSNFSVFTVGSGVTASISGLTITDGNALNGGGIFNAGTVAVTRDIIVKNSATLDGGGVFNAGTATLLCDTITLNSAIQLGGGVFNHRSATLTSDSITQNFAMAGGGVFNVAMETITLIGNTIALNGSVAENAPAYGGGVEHDGTATLINDTITLNSASSQDGVAYGGGVSNFGTATFTNVTIASNSTGFLGGGVYNAGSATLDNTLIALNNIDANSVAMPDQIDGNISGTYNLVGTGSAGGLANGLLGNQVGVANPLLATGLANNGGPTQTIALLPGSPAINAGAANIPGVTVPTTDQRGKGRVGAVDIGAFESQGFTLTSLLQSTPQHALINSAFKNSLELTVAPNNPGEPVDGGVVTFAAPTAGASATLSATTVAISGGIVTVAATANGTVGSYSVTATAAGATPASFALLNLPPPLIGVGPLTPGSGIAPVSSLDVTSNRPTNPSTATTPSLNVSDGDNAAGTAAVSLGSAADVDLIDQVIELEFGANGLDDTSAGNTTTAADRANGHRLE